MWLSAVPSPSDPLGDDNAVTFPCKEGGIIIIIIIIINSSIL